MDTHHIELCPRPKPCIVTPTADPEALYQNNEDGDDVSSRFKPEYNTSYDTPRPPPSYTSTPNYHTTRSGYRGVEDNEFNTKLLDTRDGNSNNTTAPRHIHWRTPFAMIGFFVAGIAFAIGHHAYYNSLQNQIVKDSSGSWDLVNQQWRLRFGSGFAALVKTCFVASTVVAFKQYAWTNFGRKVQSVRAIDAIISGTGNLKSFLCPDFVFRASFLPFVAAIAWLLPLSTLITPATLTVFLSQNSTTSIKNVPGINMTNPDHFEDLFYVQSTSRTLTKIASSVSTEAQILPMDVVYANSSYTMDFQGPSLKCGPAAPNETEFIDKYWVLVDPRADSISPNNFSWIPVFMGFSPNKDSKMNDTRFVSTCVIGSSMFTAVGCTALYSLDFWLLPALFLRLRDERWSCSLQITQFSANFHASDTQQTIDNSHSYKWLADWRDTAIEVSKDIREDVTVPFSPEGVEFSDPMADTRKVLESHVAITQAAINTFRAMIGVEVASNQMEAAAYVKSFNARITESAIDGLVWSSLNKTISSLSDDFADVNRNFSINSVELSAEDIALAQTRSLGSVIEEFSRNMTLSLFSRKEFWTDPGRGKDVEVTTTVPVNRYQYAADDLWLAYGISAFFTAISVALGLWALYDNGVSHNMSFSSFMATTRNPTLDKIVAQESLGAEPMSDQILRSKLRFGVLQSHGATAHMGFGLSDEVTPLQRKKTEAWSTIVPS